MLDSCVRVKGIFDVPNTFFPFQEHYERILTFTDDAGLTKPGEVGDSFALVSMKSPNCCQKAKF
jgi:hypothetical protein